MSYISNIDGWDFPRLVRTPNIENDIKNLLGDDVLTAFTQSTNDENKKKIIRITEMLDFLVHIKYFKEFLVKTDNPTHEENNGRVWIKSDIVFLDKDYSGFQFDVEAFLYYSFLSIIDALSPAQENRMELPKYIEKKVKPDEQVNVEKIQTIIKKYNERYGLSVNFKRVFTDLLPDELIKEIAENIVFIKKRSSNYTPLEIEKKIEDWLNKDVKDRCKIIASTLYSIRSKYTHENIRNFFPKPTPETIKVQEVETRDLPGDFLIVKKGYSLEDMLMKVIKSRSLHFLRQDD